MKLIKRYVLLFVMCCVSYLVNAENGVSIDNWSTCQGETKYVTSTNKPGFIDTEKWYIQDLNNNKYTSGFTMSTINSSTKSLVVNSLPASGTYAIVREIRYCNRKYLSACLEYKTQIAYGQFDYIKTIGTEHGSITSSFSNTFCETEKPTISLNIEHSDAISYYLRVVYSNGTSVKHAGGVTVPGTTRYNSNIRFDNGTNGKVKIQLWLSNNCNEIKADEIQVNVQKRLTAPSTPVGSSSICQGAKDNVYYVSAMTGAVSYNYQLLPIEAGNVQISGRNCTILLNDSYYGDVSLMAQAKNCTWGSWSNPKIITVEQEPGVASVPSVVSSEICENSKSIKFSTSADRATSYNFDFTPSSAIENPVPDGTDIYVDLHEGYSGNITVTATGKNCKEGATSEPMTVTVNPLPEKPSTISGASVVCPNSTGLFFSTELVTHATNYIWEILPQTAGTIVSNKNTAEVNLNTNFTGEFKLRVKAVSCGDGEWSNYKTVKVSEVLGNTQIPSGSADVCENNSNTTYSINSVGQASGYQWKIDPTSAGTLFPNSTSCVVDWSNTITGDVKIYAKAVNSCGESGWSQPREVKISPRSLQPSQPRGNVTVCQGSNPTIYTTTSADYANSYDWQVMPNGAGEIEGNTESAIVTWSSAFTGTASVRVRSVNDCGESEWSSVLNIAVNPLPSKAGVPIGASSTCQGTRGLNYSSLGATFATTYRWEIVPAECAELVQNGTGVTINFNSAFTGDAKLRVQGISCDVGDWSDYKNIRVKPNIGNITAPVGEVELCQDGNNTSYEVAEVANSLTHDWKIEPSNAGILNKSDNSCTINWASNFSGTAELYTKASNSCGETGWSEPLSIQAAPLPEQASQPRGDASVCQKTPSNIYNTTIVNYADSYEWELTPNGAGLVSGVGTSATVSWNEAFTGTANLRVRGVNECGVGEWAKALTIGVNPLPGKAGTPVGNQSVCQGAQGLNYSAQSAAFASSHVWDILPVGCAELVQNGSSVKVNFEPDFTGQATLQVKGVSCGDGDWSNELIITVKPNVGDIVSPVGEVELCQDGINTNYVVTTVDNALTYDWNLKPISAGIVTKNGRTCIINWASNFSGTAELYTKASNSCGETGWSEPLNIQAAELPLIAGQPKGEINVCQGLSSGTYSTNEVDYSSSYEWELKPSGAGEISGAGTIATVTWNEAFTGTANIRVRGVNDCGEGVWSSNLIVAVNPLPGKAAKPQGINSLCQGATPLNYSTLGASYAIRYNWNIEPIDCAELTLNGSSVKVKFNPDFVGQASLKVQGVSCGNGVWSDELDISVKPNVGEISKPMGDVELCQDGEDKTYTVNAVDDVLQYDWKVEPSNAGALTKNVTTCKVNWASDFAGSAELYVKASNSCGETGWSEPLKISTANLPDIASIPTGASSVCQGTTGTTYTTTTANNASSYEWELTPQGAGEITGIGTSATITWNNAFTGTASIRVRGLNGCGTGAWSRHLYVGVNPLPGRPGTPQGVSSVCQGTEKVSFTSLGASYASSYIWDITPQEAGELDYNGAQVQVKLDSNFSGQFELKVKGVSCGEGIWSDEFVVNVIPTLQAPNMISASTEICQNSDDITYNVVRDPYASSYKWSFNPPTSGFLFENNDEATMNWGAEFHGEVNIAVKSINSCGASDWSESLNINVLPTPELPNIPSIKTHACEGEELIIRVDSVQYASNYSWNITPKDAFNFASDTIHNTLSIVPKEDYSGRIYFKVRGRNSCGFSEYSQNVFVSVMMSPLDPEITLADAYCYDDDVTLRVKNNYTSLSTKWYNVNKEEFATGSEVSFNAASQYKTIYVQYTNANNCKSALQPFDLTIPEQLYPEFELSDTVIAAGDAVSCINNSSANATSFNWVFGDGLTSTIESPNHNYFSINTYTITLTAFDDYDCSRAVSKDLKVVRDNDVITNIKNTDVLGVSVYPNPTTDQLFLNTKNYSRFSKITARLFNEAGQLVQVYKLNGGSIETLDLSQLPKGNYLLSLSINGLISSQNILLQ